MGRQPQVADNLAAFKGNAHHFERRIKIAGMRKIGLNGALIGRLFAGRGRRRPLPEIIKPPGAHKVRIGLLRLTRGPGLGHVAVGDRAPGRGPFIGITTADTAERIAGIGRLDAQRRIGAGLCPGERFGLDLVDGAVRALRPQVLTDEPDQRGKKYRRQCTHRCLRACCSERWHDGVPLSFP